MSQEYLQNIPKFDGMMSSNGRNAVGSRSMGVMLPLFSVPLFHLVIQALPASAIVNPELGLSQPMLGVTRVAIAPLL